MNESDLFVLFCACLAALDDASTVYSSRIDGLLLPTDHLLMVLQ